MATLEYNNTINAPVTQQQLEQLLSRIKSHIPNLAEKTVSVAIVDEDSIRQANNAYRGKNEVTDVLSFAEAEAKDAEHSDTFGEILICYSQAVKQAQEYGTSTEEELELLFVHGFLHLLGYTHDQVEDTNEMKQMENTILSAQHSRL